jgi:RIO kinase 2
MKLDPSALRYLSRDHMRVLTATEMGMKNHDTVPVELITQIARLRHGGVRSVLSECLRHKLVHHENVKFDGYRLTNLGYDYLALNAFLCRDVITACGRQIGVGKESDIFSVANDDGDEFVLKLHRLGRTSFRAIKDKRDYHKGRGHPSWLYLSRLAANKEYLFMKALHEHGYPVPTPVDWNRHCLVMSLVDGAPLNQIKQMSRPQYVYDQMMGLVVRLAKHGLIHGDLNEFNVLVRDNSEVIMIDFPQMVSMSHPNAKMYFERDVNCIRRFFRKRFGVVAESRPQFEDMVRQKEMDLDVLVSASGFTPEMDKHLAKALREEAFHKSRGTYREDEGESDDDDDNSDDDQQDEQELDGTEDEDAEKQRAGDERAAALAEVGKSVGEDRTTTTTTQLTEEVNAMSVAASATAETNAGAVAPAVVPGVMETSAPVAAAAAGEAEGTGASEERVEAAADVPFDDDSPTAHLLYDHVLPGATNPNKTTVGRREKRPAKQRKQLSVKERVKREQHGKKNQQQGGKTSRNAIKNRERRKLDQEIRES